MTMQIWLGKGGGQVQADREVASAVERVLRAAHGRVVERLERAADRIGVPAEARWPVGKERGKPHSRDLFERGLRLPRKGVLEAFVRNGASYAYYVRSMKGGLGGKSAFVELLRKPLRTEARMVADELADDLKAEIERGLGGGRG
jgi:hypothetical protein